MCSSDSQSRLFLVFCFMAVSMYFAQSLSFKDCTSFTDCDSASEPICALDQEKVCFRQFPTECHMKAEVCENPRAYTVYHNDYCKLIGFMCKMEYKRYNEEYIKNENMDNIIYSIYRESNPKKTSK